jgi:hypothetical protein
MGTQPQSSRNLASLSKSRSLSPGLFRQAPPGAAQASAFERVLHGPELRLRLGQFGRRVGTGHDPAVGAQAWLGSRVFARENA